MRTDDHIKHIKAWVKKALKDRIFVQRKEGNLFVTCGLAAINLATTQSAWEVFKSFPHPLPETDGQFTFAKNAPPTDAGPDIIACIDKYMSCGHKAVDTGLLMKFDVGLVRIYEVNEGYAVIRDDLAAMFCESAARGGLVEAYGTKPSEPISFYRGDVFLGMVMPVHGASLPAVLQARDSLEMRMTS